MRQTLKEAKYKLCVEILDICLWCQNSNDDRGTVHTDGRLTPLESVNKTSDILQVKCIFF